VVSYDQAEQASARRGRSRETVSFQRAAPGTMRSHDALAEHSGAVIFGGPQSANDPDDFIRTGRVMAGAGKTRQIKGSKCTPDSISTDPLRVCKTARRAASTTASRMRADFAPLDEQGGRGV